LPMSTLKPNTQTTSTSLETTETTSVRRVRLYTDTLCPICEVVERYLAQEGVEYSKINIDEEPEARRALLKLGYDNLPVLDIEGTTILGFNQDAIDKILKEKGIIRK
jgi:glutaredoxin 3